MSANEFNSEAGTFVVSAPILLRCRDPVAALIGAVCRQLEDRAEARPGTGTQVISAFNEAFNNLVLHGSNEGQSCRIEIEVTAEHLVLRLIDRGAGFDPVVSRRPDPTTGEPREGGYGLHIMGSFMSKMEYVAGVDGEANVLTMVRNLGSAS